MGKVLIVDDNQGLASVIQEMLEMEGFEAQTACDGEKAIVTYLLFKPDLVITDLQMPEKDGLELMKRIRVYNPKIRTIYMSGDLTQFRSLLEDERQRFQVSLLQKPFSKLELMRLLERI